MRRTHPITSRKLFQTLLLVPAGLLLLACSDENPATAENTNTDPVGRQDMLKQAADVRHTASNTAEGPAMTQRGINGYFQVTLQSEVSPLPLNEIHNWTVQIMTSQGRVVDDAIVLVYGGMPEHKHGFPSRPEVTGNLGNGRYRIEGVKFNMPGRWEMWFNIRSLGKDDKVIFRFDVP